MQNKHQKSNQRSLKKDTGFKRVCCSVCGVCLCVTVSYALELGESFSLSPNCVYKENYCSDNQKMCKQEEVTFHYLW